MKAITLILLVDVLLLSPFVEGAAVKCKEDDKQPWSYYGSTNGPSAWGETFPACYGKLQSPININTAKVERDSKLKHLKMNSYDRPVTKAKIENTGHSVQITPEDCVSRTISINSSTFKLAQLHFHWGSRYYRGSEHTFNKQADALEAHFVHTNDNNEIAVVGVLFQESPGNNIGFDPIAEVLSEVRFEANTTSLRSNLNLSKLLPKLPLQIYRYVGSLTTPACTEGVVWSVARDILRIGTKQIKELRNLYSATKEQEYAACRLVDNFRPVQPLNGRKVTSST